MTPENRHYRAIWISDVHLGTRGCKAEFLLDFLKHNEADTWYLVGDIIDDWALKRGWGGWRQEHNDVVQKLLRKARKGARVVYIPGNHDELAREFLGMHFGGVELANAALHKTADGRRFLVMHGDQYDAVIKCAKWLAHLGSWAYDLAVVLNQWLNYVRLRFDLPYWSLAKYLKMKVKNAQNFIGDFREVMVHEARRRGFDGVICGHIHHPEITDMQGTLYINDGDWVESCTALVERENGALELLTWSRVEEAVPA